MSEVVFTAYSEYFGVEIICALDNWETHITAKADRSRLIENRDAIVEAIEHSDVITDNIPGKNPMSRNRRCFYKLNIFVEPGIPHLKVIAEFADSEQDDPWEVVTAYATPTLKKDEKVRKTHVPYNTFR